MKERGSMLRERGETRWPKRLASGICVLPLPSLLFERPAILAPAAQYVRNLRYEAGKHRLRKETRRVYYRKLQSKTTPLLPLPVFLLVGTAVFASRTEYVHDLRNEAGEHRLSRTHTGVKATLPSSDRMRSHRMNRQQWHLTRDTHVRCVLWSHRYTIDSFRIYFKLHLVLEYLHHLVAASNRVTTLAKLFAHTCLLKRHYINSNCHQPAEFGTGL